MSRRTCSVMCPIINNGRYCLGKSLFQCGVIDNCSSIETIFLLLVTVTTVGPTPPITPLVSVFQISLLTCVLDDTPILPEDVGRDSIKILKNGPQTVCFGVFIIW